MSAALSLATQLADEIDQFPLGKCGPSDDPDMQYAYVAGFRDITNRFVAAVKRIGDPDLSALVISLNTSPQWISEAHDLRAELYVVIDTLNEVAQNPNHAANVASNAAFLNTEVLIQLKAVRGARLDLTKLVKMCEELGFRHLTTQDPANSYSKSLVTVLPDLRNNSAHGSTDLTPDCVGRPTLESSTAATPPRSTIEADTASPA